MPAYSSEEHSNEIELVGTLVLRIAVGLTADQEPREEHVQQHVAKHRTDRQFVLIAGSLLGIYWDGSGGRHDHELNRAQAYFTKPVL